MHLTTQEDCERLLDELNIPLRIRNHTNQVLNVALFIAKKLNKAGKNINIEILEKAALMHDCDKLIVKDQSNKKHGFVGFEILIENGFSTEIADLVKYHANKAPKEFNNKWELKVLRYADARCSGDLIVSAKERLNHIISKYPHYKFLYKVMKENEKEIFSLLDFKPEDLKKEIKKVAT